MVNNKKKKGKNKQSKSVALQQSTNKVAATTASSLTAVLPPSLRDVVEELKYNNNNNNDTNQMQLSLESNNNINRSCVDKYDDDYNQHDDADADDDNGTLIGPNGIKKKSLPQEDMNVTYALHDAISSVDRALDEFYAYAGIPADSENSISQYYPKSYKHSNNNSNNNSNNKNISKNNKKQVLSADQQQKLLLRSQNDDYDIVRNNPLAHSSAIAPSTATATTTQSLLTLAESMGALSTQLLSMQGKEK
jgi:hypothetical protein